MIYTYAIIRSPETPLQMPPGLRSPLKMEITGNSAAVFEVDLSLEALEADDALLLQAVVHHDRVIRDLFAQTAVLPLRFGTYFLSLERLQAHLKLQSERYEQQLERFASRAEFALKLFPAEPPSEAAGAGSDNATGGRAYFLAKKQRHQQLQAFKAQQQMEKERLLAAIAAQGGEICTLDPDEAGNERLCFLGDRAGIDAACWQQWCDLAPHWQLQRSEALPPYHFLAVAAPAPEPEA